MTRNKAVRMPLVVLLLASMMVLGTDRADAHPAILWYPFWWKATPTVPFYWADPDFNDGAVPGAAGRARIGNDHAEWNKLNQSMRFADGGFNYSLSPNDCNGEDQNGIYWYDIADPAGENRLAEVQACVFSNDQTTYWSYQMSFDSQDPWYAGTGTPGLGQNDLWGVAAHEAGHTFGLPHVVADTASVRKSADITTQQSETAAPGSVVGFRRNSEIQAKHLVRPSIIACDHSRIIRTRDRINRYA